MKTVTKWLVAASGAAAVLIFFACNKSNSANSNPNIPKGESQLSVYMMDGPASFAKVLIDIRQVAVEIDTASKQSDADEDDEWNDDFDGRHHDPDHKSVIWDTLKITPGVYNLLDLRNGTDTLLSSSLITTGKILKVKITLGPNDTLYVDSTSYFPLGVDGPHMTITINVRGDNVQSINNNTFKLWLDFNLDRSIEFENGEFVLRPFIVVFNDVDMAKVVGRVLPEGADAAVIGTMGTDTIYAVPWEEGNFQFRNVPAGTWDFTYKGANGYKDTTINNIKVDSMQTVTLPTITLHK